MELIFFRLIKSILVIVITLTLIIVSLIIYILIFSKSGFKIELANDVLKINENYYSGLITIIVSIITLALPLSMNAISANQDKRFSNNELAESFYRNTNYKFIKYSVPLLIILLITSYFKEPNIYLNGLLTMSVIWVLIVFVKFMKTVESYVSNFPSILIQEEKENIERIIRG